MTTAKGSFFENIQWLAQKLGKDYALSNLMNNQKLRELVEGPNNERDFRNKLIKQAEKAALLKNIKFET